MNMSKRFPERIATLTLLTLMAVCMPAMAYSADATGWYEQGNVFLNANNATGAIAAYDHAVALEPDFYEAWDARADALNRDGQFSAALQDSDHALQINSSYVPGWINRGQILYNIGMVYEDQKNDLTTANEYYAEQLLAFEKAIELDPASAEAWFNKGYALAGMKKYDEAIAAFDRVQALDPNYPNIAKNKEIAQQLKNKTTPDYMQYSPAFLGIAVIIIGIIIWFKFLREKEE
jgi:tetratricopeptide (TPR) repeat protein